jgi:hypothetical protein
MIGSSLLGGNSHQQAKAGSFIWRELDVWMRGL